MSGLRSTLYGSASNPLTSVNESCPECAGVLVAQLEQPCSDRVRFAEASLAREALAHWWSICAVRCGCGWIGSAFRPEEAIAA